MRVLAMLHLAPPHHCAGAEMMVFAMFRALVDAGHDVDVQLSQRHAQIRQPYEVDGVRVWPHRGKGDVWPLLAGADVLVTHLENTPRATVLGQVNNLPIVHVCHNTYDPPKTWMGRGPVALAVFNSEWMRADYEAWFARERKQMPPAVVVRPPVHAAEYATEPGDRVTLINLYEPKGVDLFWRLAKRMPDVKFLGVTGAYGKQDIRDLPNVEVLPHTPWMRDDVYARTRILLVPSVYESWGRVGVEAMASGIPVVAHPTPGLLESLGAAGIFVDRDDEDAWVAAIRQLRKPPVWKAASRRAQARSAELDPTQDLAAWVDAVEQLGDRSRRVLAAVASRR